MPEFDLDFTLLLVCSGLMIGLMYALIALGFVLVYKATDAINFAQGEFVMLAAIIAAASLGASMPFWLAAAIALVGMIAFCFGLERVVLRQLLGRPVVAVIMATIGLASLIRGVATLAVLLLDCSSFASIPITSHTASTISGTRTGRPGCSPPRPRRRPR